MSDWGSGEWDARYNDANARRLAEQEAARAAMSAPRLVHAVVAGVVGLVLCIIVAALVVL